MLKAGLPFHSEWVLECGISQKQAAGDDRPAAPESDHYRGAVLQQRGSHRRRGSGLLRAGRQSGKMASRALL
ncbi:hypothetical protein MJ575_13745 [Klebsiella pneumoniae]|nr:hypothetical protein MJ575_13745 [Klebsiella pneumoniae]